MNEASSKPKSEFDHSGSSFDSFLDEEGILEEVEAAAIKKVIAWQLTETMKAQHISKKAMAARMGTSRSQLDRVLDPGYVTIKLDTLMKAARAVGQNVRILFEPLPPRQRG